MNLEELAQPKPTQKPAQAPQQKQLQPQPQQPTQQQPKSMKIQSVTKVVVTNNGKIVGELLGREGDEAIWEYFRRHWAPWFPGLGDRSPFVRQAANLWWVKQRLQERLVTDLGARTADWHVIDGFPIRVCQRARAPGSKVLKAEADSGDCAAKDEHDYGLRGPGY